MEENDNKDDEILEVDGWVKSKNDEASSEENVKDIKYWRNMLGIGLTPYVCMLLIAIIGAFNNPSFMGSSVSWFDAFLLGIIFSFMVLWFIFIPAGILVIVSIIKVSNYKKYRG